MEVEPVEKENNAASVDRDDDDKSADETGEKPAGGEIDRKKEKAKKKKEAKKERDKEKKDDKKEHADKKKKAQVDFIKEQIKKRQEEEERVRKEQEEKEHRLEELENQRLEKLRLEQERKDRKKQKEKERVERLKKEGKYLTPEQKQKLQRQRDMVEMLKQQGVVVQGMEGKEAAVTKRPKYADKKKGKKPTQQEAAGSRDNTPLDETNEKDEDQDESEDEGDAHNEIAESWDQVDEQENQKPQTAADEDLSSSSEEEKDEQQKSTENGDLKREISIDNGEKKPVENSQQKQPPPVSFQHETKEETRERIVNRIKARREQARSKRSTEVLRSPVICVLGHVDTGKTKILDKIRRTNVQDGEAGGITQQIGATFVPADAIKEQAKMVKDFMAADLRLPGLLVIDTPGHESFSNLRSRGSSLCDIAILVVDVMHALEPQTIESINLLKKRNTPFVVALNKVDRLYEWKPNPHKDVKSVLKSQQRNCQLEFDERFHDIKAKFSEQGINVALFWENNDLSEYVSVVPTSAHSGDGMGNLMATVAHHTQTLLADRVAFTEDLQCTVLEVKVLPGLGTTIDVILVNGTLHVGDTIIVPGTEGPIVTQIRELLMPQPMREMRVKNPYEHYKEIKGAQGIKILAKDMEKALAGLPLLVAQNEDEIEILKEEVADSLKKALQSIRLSERGVYVQASTLGALEALLTFLRDQKIPYCGINIGPVHKRDVVKASTMLEHDSQWAVILAFDVKIERDAQLLADELGVRVFSADIIYHLQDAFVKYREELKEKKRQENAHLAVFPCKLRVLPNHIYNSRDPMVMGVVVEDGICKVGTPICVPSKECTFLGTISSVEINHKQADTARKGQEVCVKIENTTGEAPKMYGRHFDYEDVLVSRISRESIDVMKTYFRDDLQKPDWQLIVELKKMLNIL